MALSPALKVAGSAMTSVAEGPPDPGTVPEALKRQMFESWWPAFQTPPWWKALTR